jgi:predicted ArsR family transcriptional regulator
MKSTRDLILQNLLKKPRSSINELAKSVGINNISVRHHLINLQAEGVIMAEEERHGVGRPRLVYYLTEKGLERFPAGYLRLTNRLIEQMKKSLPEKTFQELFEQLAQELAETYTEKTKKLSLEGKMEFLKETMTKEGFSIEIEKTPDGYFINTISCPYYHVSQKHPEVCLMDQAIISSILAIPSEKINCILNGDSHCSYLIHNHDTQQEGNSK